MQPPTFIASHLPLRVHLERLRAAAQTVRTEQAAQNHLQTMRDQLTEWVASMNPEQRQRRFTIEEVERLAGLTGKHGGRAAHRHIAHALHRIGFIHLRDWSVAGRNRRFWQFERSHP